MKNTIIKSHLLICLIICTFNTYAQSKEVDVPLGKGETLLRFVDLADKGFIIKTGKGKYGIKKANMQLKYYSKDLELLWDVPIANAFGWEGNYSPIVVSPDGSIVYHIQHQQGYDKAKISWYEDLSVMQIKKDGTIQTKLIKGVNGFGDLIGETNSRLNTFFCNSKYLLILSHGGKETTLSEDYLPKTQMILERISHDDLSFSTVQLDLPKLEKRSIYMVNTAYNTVCTNDYWNYAGTDKENFFVSLARVFVQKNIHTTRVLKLSDEGEILSSTKLNTNLDDVYPRASVSVSLNSNTHLCNYISGWDYRFYAASRGRFTSYVQLFTVEYINGSFYVYGLTGEDEMQSFGTKYRGYFINKFDINGNLVQEVNQKQAKTLSNNGYFRMHAIIESRTIGLKILSDSEFQFSAWSKSRIYTSSYENGKFKGENVKKIKDRISYSHVPQASPTLKTTTGDILKKKEFRSSRNLWYINSTINSDAIVLLMPGKRKIKLMLVEK